ncbi:(d)CMP kinase [Candidatus Kinetoplastidibacterium crithidiae]|uniref:Cytidylate kinase n=1 Tax=Candidatus Kinetoplastidibacterium crithidiae TCC036E TaxID=1208918 RepID=M1M6K0_9PROT|nr:(d)CMP kinase [Candidatus Kinetoplastibacterium crithidii]AFZ82629.1 cytidylate kinase [Candidatus Kinetoplastibacterium crithidii (ex Angomonas deanei ATCC 30255)]AGF47710.1 cytidylate kinase [Candidatus Kinetoplastibacterium crithidii TCC036E]
MNIKNNIPIIAIDGPTASGKGTVAFSLAKILGWSILDSGAIYRSLAFFIIQNSISYTDINAILSLLKTLKFSFHSNNIHVNSLDITEKIRNEDVGKLASIISENRIIRDSLLNIQRSCIQEPGLIADGRDMGTVVFPFASLKIFLTANIDIRVERRYKQLITSKVSVNISNLRSAIIDRDLRDTQRVVSPLIPAYDAHILDSSYLTNDETVSVILDLWKNRHY